MRPFSPVPLTLVEIDAQSRAPTRRTLGPACTPAKSALRGGGLRADGPCGERSPAQSAAATAVAGSCCDSSDGRLAHAPSSLPRSSRIGVPSLTRSPTFTST